MADNSPMTREIRLDKIMLALRLKQWQKAVKLVNEDVIFYEGAATPYLDRAEFRQAIIEYGNADTQLLLAIVNITNAMSDGQQDILNVALKQTNLVKAVSPRVLERAILDCLHNDCSKTSMTDIIIALLDAGLDPNIKIKEEPLLLTALQLHNYTVVSKLLIMPELLVTEQYLQAVNDDLSPLLRIQHSVIERLIASRSS